LKKGEKKVVRHRQRQDLHGRSAREKKIGKPAGSSRWEGKRRKEEKRESGDRRARVHPTPKPRARRGKEVRGQHTE